MLVHEFPERVRGLRTVAGGAHACPLSMPAADPTLLSFLPTQVARSLPQQPCGGARMLLRHHAA